MPNPPPPAGQGEDTLLSGNNKKDHWRFGGILAGGVVLAVVDRSVDSDGLRAFFFALVGAVGMFWASVPLLSDPDARQGAKRWSAWFTMLAAATVFGASVIEVGVQLEELRVEWLKD